MDWRCEEGIAMRTQKNRDVVKATVCQDHMNVGTSFRQVGWPHLKKEK